MSFYIQEFDMMGDKTILTVLLVAYFSCFCLRCIKADENSILFSNDFSDPDNVKGLRIQQGECMIEEEALVLRKSRDAVKMGNEQWTDYTLEFRMKRMEIDQMLKGDHVAVNVRQSDNGLYGYLFIFTKAYVEAIIIMVLRSLE